MENTPGGIASPQGCPGGDAHETPERRRNECVTIHPPDKEPRSQTAATLRSLTHVPQHPLGDVGVDGVGGDERVVVIGGGISIHFFGVDAGRESYRHLPRAMAETWSVVPWAIKVGMRIDAACLAGWMSARWMPDFQ